MYFVSIACRTLESAQKLSEGFKNAKAISLDVNDDAALDKAMEGVDLVISLIPYTFHATVIKSAIRTKKDVVTTSYVSPAMLELDEECKKAGITVMNEIGLGKFFSYEAIRLFSSTNFRLSIDPGIDHLCKHLCKT